MKKTFSKKFWIGLSSFLLVGAGIVLACSGGYWEEYGSSNFTPETIVGAKYKPFFYSYNFYYEINYDEKHNKRFNKNIVSDWRNYFDNKCSEQELNYLLFQTTESSIDSISKALKKDDSYFPYPAKTISVLKERKSKKTNDFISYLWIAKKCEAFALKKDDEYWSYDSKPNSRICPTELADLVKNQYKTIKDPFLKERYFFQSIRALYFNRNYSECSQLFEAEKNNLPKNYLYYRSMAYAAGAYYKAKDYARSNYYFSLVYQGNDDLKTVAHWSFKPLEEKNWQATLDLCKNNEEKITLWQMLGVFYNDEIRSMNEIFKLDPSSEKLDLLLARAINKYENDRFDFDNRLKNSDPAKTDKLKIFIQEALTNKTISKIYMWQMAAGYIDIMDQQYAMAEAHLKEAEKTLPNTPLAKAQLRTLKLINDVYALKTIDEKAENKLLPEISWLKAMQSDTSLKEFRRNQTYTWLLGAMSRKYKSQKDFMKSEFFVVDQSYYFKDQQLQNMKAFLKKKNKTPYELLCQDIYSLSFEGLVEFEAISKTFDDKIDEAIPLMEQAGKNGQSELLSNPFNAHIKDCHDCDHAQPQKTKYTKLMTVKKMKEIKDKITSDPYNNALLLANAFYNMTYYGSSRLFYECSVIGAYSSAPEYVENSFMNKLLDMTMARKYYYIALSGAKTPEQKAKCLYMLAKCERNDWYTSGQGPKPGKDFIAWKQFLALKAYSQTNYYKDVIKECGYFKAYAGR